MAVGRRRHHAARRRNAASAGLVLDKKALRKGLGKFLRNDARGRIGDAAGCEWNDDSNWPVRIIRLRTRSGADTRAGKTAATSLIPPRFTS